MTFAFTEVRIGVVAAIISVPIFRRVAPSLLASALLTGEPFDVEHARRVGLVTHVSHDVTAVVDHLCTAITLGGPAAVAATKRMLHDAGTDGSAGRDEAVRPDARAVRRTLPERRSRRGHGGIRRKAPAVVAGMIATSFAGMFARSLSALVVAPMAVVIATTEPPPSTSSEDSRGLTEMVAMVPADAFQPGSDAQLYYVDMALLWDQLGAGPDPAEREERLGEFSRIENYALAPQLFLRQLFQFDAARTEIGFSTVEIDREIAVLSPPNNLFIDATNVPASDIEAALASDPTWSPELTTVDTEFGSYHSWGGDGAEMNLDRISPLRPFGQGGQLAVVGDPMATTIRTLDPAEMEAALATTAGAADSAATSIVLAPVLDALSGATVLQLVATATGPMFDPGALLLTELEFEEILESSVFLEPYIGVAIVELERRTAGAPKSFWCTRTSIRQPPTPNWRRRCSPRMSTC